MMQHTFLQGADMFENEKMLVEEIVKILEVKRESLPKLIRSGNMRVMREVNLGYGIADIVIALYGDIEKSRTMFLNSTQIRILSIVQNNPGITINSIKDSTKASSRLIRESLEILGGERLVTIVEQSIFPDESYVSTLTTSIAIEAKLTNWKRALKQALRYKWFSERSYVCLPVANIKPALSNIDYFKKLKVGLISVSNDGGYKILYNPRPTKPICGEKNILLNEWLLSEIHSS
jgi:hypothetical protein